jgi:hypothetical protein
MCFILNHNLFIDLNPQPEPGEIKIKKTIMIKRGNSEHDLPAP